MHIPTIDIASFAQGSTSQRAAVAAQIDAAARQIGFMQITGHGIPEAVVAALAQGMDDFFGLPLRQKEAWRPSAVEINRGYTSPLSERLSYSAGVASAADLFEAFNVGSAHTDFPGLTLDPIAYPDNLWPTDCPSFQAAVQLWFRHAGEVAREMTRIFEVALGLPAHYFAPFQDHSLDVLRLNHYAMPPEVTRVEQDQMGMGAHTDFGIVTVLWADAVSPGLQVLTAEGHWIDAIPQPGALLINLGDMMARWTNDHWLSSMHRVVPPIDGQGQVVRRRSAAYFHDGNADAVITCLPSCSDAARPPRYPAITVAEHIRQKLAGSRALHINDAADKEAARILTAKVASNAR